jgi:hypothetical protein
MGMATLRSSSQRFDTYGYFYGYWTMKKPRGDRRDSRSQAPRLADDKGNRYCGTLTIIKVDIVSSIDYFTRLTSIGLLGEVLCYHS